METPASGTNGTNGAAAAGTNAIKIWFYPGNSVGHEFIYPRSQAMRIASRTGSSVLTTKSEAEVEASVADADLTRVDRAGTDSTVSVEASAETHPAVTRERRSLAPERLPRRPSRRLRRRAGHGSRADARSLDRHGTHRSAEHGEPLAAGGGDWPWFAGGQPLAAPLAARERVEGEVRS